MHVLLYTTTSTNNFPKKSHAEQFNAQITLLFTSNISFHSHLKKVEARLVDEVEFCSFFAAIHNCCFLVCHTKLCTYFNHVRFFTKQYVAAAIFLIVDSFQDSLHVLSAQLVMHRKADDLLRDAVGDRKVLLRRRLQAPVCRELADQGIEVSAAVDVP